MVNPDDVPAGDSWVCSSGGYICAMPSHSDGLPLVAYAHMVRRRWVLVTLVVLAMAVPAVIVSLQQRSEYQAVAQVLLTRQQLDEEFNITPGTLTDTQISNEVALMTSAEVAGRARALGATSTVNAVGKASSNVVTITGLAPDPRQAADTVDAYIRGYADYRTDVVRTTLDATAKQLQTTATGLQQQLSQLGRSSQDAANRTLLQQQLATVQARLSRVEIQQQLVAPGMTVVQPSVADPDRVSPTPVRNGLFGVVVGLILGISLAVLLESLRQRRPSVPLGTDDRASGDAPPIAAPTVPVPPVAGPRTRRRPAPPLGRPPVALSDASSVVGRHKNLGGNGGNGSGHA